MRTCTQCKETKPIEGFYTYRKPDGRTAQHAACKECQRAYFRRRNKKPEYLAKERARRARNRDRERERHKRHRRKSAKRRQSDNDRARARRARMLEAEGLVSQNFEELALIAQDGDCYYCGAFIAEGWYHWEHKTPLSRGGRHEDSNLALACPLCNLKKHARTEPEYLRSRLHKERHREVISIGFARSRRAA